jgi:hypothetical protein
MLGAIIAVLLGLPAALAQDSTCVSLARISKLW